MPHWFVWVGLLFLIEPPSDLDLDLVPKFAAALVMARILRLSFLRLGITMERYSEQCFQ